MYGAPRKHLRPLGTTSDAGSVACAACPAIYLFSPGHCQVPVLAFMIGCFMAVLLSILAFCLYRRRRRRLVRKRKLKKDLRAQKTLAEASDMRTPLTNAHVYVCGQQRRTAHHTKGGIWPANTNTALSASLVWPTPACVALSVCDTANNNTAGLPPL